jgi:hypothetical protein
MEKVYQRDYGRKRYLYSKDAGHGWPQTAMHVLYTYEDVTPIISHSTTVHAIPVLTTWHRPNDISLLSDERLLVEPPRWSD